MMFIENSFRVKTVLRVFLLAALIACMCSCSYGSAYLVRHGDDGLTGKFFAAVSEKFDRSGINDPVNGARVVIGVADWTDDGMLKFRYRLEIYKRSSPSIVEGECIEKFMDNCAKEVVLKISKSIGRRLTLDVETGASE